MRLTRVAAKNSIATVLVAICALAGASPAAACTRPLWNRPYDGAAATLVAEGWIERVVVRTDFYDRVFAFTPVDVVIRAEAAHKGQVPSVFAFRESTSLVVFTNPFGIVHDHSWAGSSGACGLFDADPTGLYVLVALRDDADPSGPAVVQTVRMGRQPNDPWVAELRQEIQSSPPPSEPARIVHEAATWVFPPAPLPLVLALLVATGGAVSLIVTGGLPVWLRHKR